MVSVFEHESFKDISTHLSQLCAVICTRSLLHACRGMLSLCVYKDLHVLRAFIVQQRVGELSESSTLSIFRQRSTCWTAPQIKTEREKHNLPRIRWKFMTGEESSFHPCTVVIFILLAQQNHWANSSWTCWNCTTCQFPDYKSINFKTVAVYSNGAQE